MRTLLIKIPLRFNVNWQIGLIALILMAANTAFGQSSSSGSINIPFPVRVSIFAGNQLSQNNIGSAFTKTINHIAYGADLNIPIKQIYFTAGVTGWMVPSEFFLVGPYLGYAGSYTDIFLGVAIGEFKKNDVNSSVNPVQTTTQSATLGCGIVGLRQYFGSGFNFGAGFTGFWCNSDKYNQEVQTGNSGTPVKTEIKEGSSSYGGLMYLMFFWNDTGRYMKDY